MKKYTMSLISILLIAALLVGCGSKPVETKETSQEVLDLVQEGDELYASGDYIGSLEKYLTATEQDMKNMEARFGAVRCQIALGNYQIAVTNLELARQIEPELPEICDLYFELSEKSGNIGYGQTAVELAHQYNHTRILEKVPREPSLSLGSGSYGENIYINLIAEDPDAEIYYTLTNSNNYNYNIYDMKYQGEIKLQRGQNNLSAYVYKDGIPSKTVTADYVIDYPEEEVYFYDYHMEELIRYYTGKYSEPITNYDCENIDQFSHSDFYNLYYDYYSVQRIQYSSLEDLRKLPGITYLYLFNQRNLTDFSPLADCSALYQIRLDNCNLQNADVVKYVPNLRYLQLGNNYITDFSAMAEVDSLWGLDVHYNPGDGNLDQVIRANPELYQLIMDDVHLYDYSVLTEIEDLQTLEIFGLSYVDFSVFPQLTDMIGLYLHYNSERGERNTELTDLSFLVNMPHLETLYLEGVKDPAQLEYIKGLTNLQTLYLYNCEAMEDYNVVASLKQSLPNCSITY